MRRRILIGLGVASLGLGFFSGSASATNYHHPSCFGGIHKTINTVGFGGQGQNALAHMLCAH